MRTRTLLAAILACSTAACFAGCGLGALGSTALVAWIAVDDGGGDEEPAPPQHISNPPAGSVWTEPGTSIVQPGGTVTVKVIINTDAAVVGSYSMRLTWDSAAFTLQSVNGGTSALGTPYIADTASAGTVFLSDMNAADPDRSVKGVQEVAVLTFQATGASGSQMHLEGRVLNMADREYPSGDIGGTPLPRNVKVGKDVIIE